MRIFNQNPGKQYPTKALYDLKATIKLLKKHYRKGDPYLVLAIENARRIYLNTKTPVKSKRNSHIEHFVAHALNGKVRSYCKHRIPARKR